MNNIQFIDKLKELTVNRTIQWRLLRNDVFRHSTKSQIVEISRNTYSLFPGASTYKFEVFDREMKIFSHTVEYFHRSRPLETHISELFDEVHKKYEDQLSVSYTSIIDSSINGSNK